METNPASLFFVIASVTRYVKSNNETLAKNAITLKSPNIFSDISNSEYFTCGSAIE